MFRFKSVERLRALLTSANPKPLFRQNAVLRSRSFAFMYSSLGGGVDGKALPPELSESVVRLRSNSTREGGVCDVYLVGTDHYSPESSREVRSVINSLKPEGVFLGLCPTLANDLKSDQVITEFRVAYEEAQKYGGKVILGDRPRKITWYRALRGPSLLASAPLFLCPNKAWDFMNPVKNFSYDQLPNKSTINKFFLSNLKEHFLNERDQYMSATLLNVARDQKLVVAVVEKCHLPGISKYWKQPIEVKQLLSTPSWSFGEPLATELIRCSPGPPPM